VAEQGRPSTLFANGTIVGSGAEGSARADAVLVDGDRIAWTGPVDDAPAASSTIDLEGRYVLPGLTDAHSHMLAAGQDQLQVPLDGDAHRTVADVLDTLRHVASTLPDGEWLGASRLFADQLAEDRFPTREEIDRAVPDHPVVVRCLGGHAGVVNSRALTAVQHDAVLRNADPEEVRTGRLTELSAQVVFDAQPAPSSERLAAATLSVATDYLRYGVTSVVEAAVGFTNGFDEEWSVWEQLRLSGRFPVRMAFMLRLDHEEAVARGFRPGPIDPDWQVRTLKFFADGIVGARTASFHGGYCDCPENLGDILYPVEQLVEQFVAAHQVGWQLAVHAIGDRAIDDVIEAYTACGPGSMRHRIEHMALPSAAHLQAVDQLGLTVVTQYGFLPVMGDMFSAALGDGRAARLYPGRRLLDGGVSVAGSSDFPIGLFSPFRGIASGQDRRTSSAALAPEQALRPDEALGIYTEGATRVMFHEALRGRVQPGLAADLTVVDADPLTAEPGAVAELEAALTMVRGEVLFDQR
jgi:predicted amidohydrolase YtcJ